jgi:DNA-directed RNA polymerase subunit RPC12/RpoP
MSDAPTKPQKPAIKVNVVRCGGDDCEALLALEETSEGLLLGNMFGLATQDGDVRFFPCPSCGGRILVEEVEHKGKIRTRISGFTVPAP